MSFDDLTSKEEKALKLELQRLRTPTHSRRSLSAVVALTSLYCLSITYNCYNLAQTRGWNARVNLATSYVVAAKMLSNDEYFKKGVGIYVGAKRVVDDDFNRAIHHVEFYQKESEKTREEFDEQINRLFIPHF